MAVYPVFGEMASRPVKAFGLPGWKAPVGRASWPPWKPAATIHGNSYAST